MTGIVVGLVGPDGAGKSSLARRLAARPEQPTVVVYAGDNPESSNLSLPTSRLLWWFRRRGGRSLDHGPPVRRERRRRPLATRLLLAPRAVLLLANQCAEELYRLRRARAWARSGRVVVLDRSYLHDYHRHDVVGDDRSILRRFHGWWLLHVLPRPDVVLFLDAPVEVLHRRKPEGDLADLERRRLEYVDLEPFAERSARIDVSLPFDEVVRQVLAVVDGALADRARSGA